MMWRKAEFAYGAYTIMDIHDSPFTIHDSGFGIRDILEKRITIVRCMSGIRITCICESVRVEETLHRLSWSSTDDQPNVS